MTGLLIAAGILLFLLLSPIRLWARYGETLEAKAGYLFISYRLYPQKEKQEKPPKEEPKDTEEKPERPNKIKKLFEERGLSGMLDLLKKAMQMMEGPLRGLLSHIWVKRLLCEITVAAEDAAETALTYGKACAVVYPAAAMLTNAAHCREVIVAVAPDFQKKDSEVLAELKLSIRLVFVLSSALRALFAYMKFRKAENL